MAYDRIVLKPKPSQLSQSPLILGPLGQTLVSDMTFYCRAPMLLGVWTAEQVAPIVCFAFMALLL